MQLREMRYLTEMSAEAMAERMVTGQASGIPTIVAQLAATIARNDFYVVTDGLSADLEPDDIPGYVAGIRASVDRGYRDEEDSGRGYYDGLVAGLGWLAAKLDASPLPFVESQRLGAIDSYWGEMVEIVRRALVIPEPDTDSFAEALTLG